MYIHSGFIPIQISIFDPLHYHLSEGPMQWVFYLLSNPQRWYKHWNPSEIKKRTLLKWVVAKAKTSPSGTSPSYAWLLQHHPRWAWEKKKALFCRPQVQLEMPVLWENISTPYYLNLLFINTHQEEFCLYSSQLKFLFSVILLHVYRIYIYIYIYTHPGIAEMQL